MSYNITVCPLTVAMKTWTKTNFFFGLAKIGCEEYLQHPGAFHLILKKKFVLARFHLHSVNKNAEFKKSWGGGTYLWIICKLDLKHSFHASKYLLSIDFIISLQNFHHSVVYVFNWSLCRNMTNALHLILVKLKLDNNAYIPKLFWGL